MNPAPANAAPPLADRLKSVHVGLRQDLEVTRHVFRGVPCYIVRDPITFQSHRLGLEDYRLFISIDTQRSLGETFDEVVSAGLLEADEEDTFYQFILNLHRFGFLNLPVTDDRLLFRRHQARAKARRRQKLIGFLAVQIPLVKPDAFLTRTLHWGRRLFSTWFFVGWLVMVGSAACVAATRWADLVQPVQGLLVAHNLPLLWLTLIGLKVCHEFGHAYACKHFGGHVPEMGIYLIMFTPCAYVDATAAWGFPRRRDRLVVSLAGLYVELALAALAVLVWASTGPSLLNAAAYNVIFLASAVTLLFNANPLMRYDGYYVVSDLVEVPNLRQRSAQYMLALAKRLLLGIRNPSPPATWRLRIILLVFGAASTAYRTMVMLAIAAVVASKLFLVGFTLGVAYLGVTVYGLTRRLGRYLWYAEETAAVRVRAIALSVFVFALVPAFVGLVPVPSSVYAAAAVIAEHETVVRAAVPGFVRRIGFERGQTLAPGALLVELGDTASEENLAQARAEVEASELRRSGYEPTDPAAAQQEAERTRKHQAELARVRSRQAELQITAPDGGRVAAGLKPTQMGKFVRVGEPVATLIAGDCELRAVLTAEEFATAQPKVGQSVRFRPAGAPDLSLIGTIRDVRPAASRTIDLVALTHVAGGHIAIDAGTGQAQQPYLELVVTLDPSAASAAVHNMTGVVQLPATSESIAARLYRRTVRFINNLLKS